MEQIDTQQWILVSDLCVNLNVEISVVDTLHATGLIEITLIKKMPYVHISQLQQLEKLIRLYNELDINIEGIETIQYLLERISKLQTENTDLKNRLRFHEANDL